jgi:hypothetical protein
MIINKSLTEEAIFTVSLRNTNYNCFITLNLEPDGTPIRYQS